MHRAEIYEVKVLADELLATDNFAGRLCLFPLVLRLMVDCPCSIGWFHSHVYKISTNRDSLDFKKSEWRREGKGMVGYRRSQRWGGGFDQKHIICMYGILKQSTKKRLALVISTACVHY